MQLLHIFCLAIFTVLLNVTLSSGQLPPRLSIPGALLVTQARPAPFRQQRFQNEAVQPAKQRTIQNAVPVPVRPVVEEPEELPGTQPTFDDDVSKLGISVLQSAVRQAQIPEDEDPHVVHFRPERPVPVLRHDFRENLLTSARPINRQDHREHISPPITRPEQRDEIQVPVRQPIRHAQIRQQKPPPQLQLNRQQSKIPSLTRPAQSVDADRNGRTRKPPVQILRKYRNDNVDGSITWGYENEDGSFKEETLGVDCVTRGKYGYIDPDGVRRDYSYETGNKCEQREDQNDDSLLEKQVQAKPRKPQFRPAPSF